MKYSLELDELKRQIAIQGSDKVLERHSNLAHLVSHIEEAEHAAKEWAGIS